MDGFAAQSVTIADGHSVHIDDEQFATSDYENLLAGNSHEHRPAIHFNSDDTLPVLATPTHELHQIERSRTGHARMPFAEV